MPKIESAFSSIASSTRGGLRGVATPRRRVIDEDKENRVVGETPYASVKVKIEGPEPVEVSHRLAKKTRQRLASASGGSSRDLQLKEASRVAAMSLRRANPAVIPDSSQNNVLPPPPMGQLDPDIPEAPPAGPGTRPQQQLPQDLVPSQATATPASNEDLEMQARRLQRSEKRLKSQLLQLKEDMKDVQGELQETRTEFLNAMERLDEEEARAMDLETGVDQFRRWWLNEYHFVRLLLQMVPDPREVEVIAASSHARYRTVFED
ncbi:hypothetical protein MD484_g6008, partial [Candolleomyces efflorescens]